MLELLKEVAPRVTRVAILSNPDADPGAGPISVAAAPKFAVEVVSAPLADANEIETAMMRSGDASRMSD